MIDRPKDKVSFIMDAPMALRSDGRTDKVNYNIALLQIISYIIVRERGHIGLFIILVPKVL